MLYNLRFKGIHGYCAELITDESYNIWYLSVTGYQTMIKGITSNILKGEPVAISIKGSEVYFRKVEDMQYSIITHKLFSGLSNTAMLPRLAMKCDENKEDFMIIVDDKEAAKIQFFDHLDEKTEIPLHRSWTDWLWDMFVKNEWLIELKTYIGKSYGYLVQFDESELEQSIAESIAMQLPQLMTCFQKGEHYADHRTQGVS